MQLFLIKSMILYVTATSTYADADSSNMPALRGAVVADFAQELAQLEGSCSGLSGDDEYDPCWIHTGCNLPAIPFYDDSSGGHSGRGTTGWYCNDRVGATVCDKCRIKKGCNASDNCFPKFIDNTVWECVCT